MSDTKDTILRVIGDVAPEAELEDLDEQADLRDELEIDSMDLLNVLIGIDEALGVTVAERDYAEVRTLASLVAYVDARRPASPA